MKTSGWFLDRLWFLLLFVSLLSPAVRTLSPNSVRYPSSSGKKRKPAWTDRILWRLRPKPSAPQEQGQSPLEAKKVEEDEEYPLKIKQDLYTSNMDYRVSDHKPVIGLFTLEVRKTEPVNQLTHHHPLMD